MSLCSIYSDNEQSSFELSKFVQKIFDIGNGEVILLSQDNVLLLCKTLSNESSNSSIIELKQQVQDADIRDNTIYIVEGNGCVSRTSTTNISDNEWEKISVPDSVARICVNIQGVLMINMKNELIGYGNFENVLKSEKPVTVECFKNFNVLDACTGDHFVVVLVQQKSILNEISNSDRNNLMLQSKNEGCKLLRTQVWTFGSLNKGLLGTGDHVKRNDSTVLVKLADIGINKICCGSNHAAALSIDGRLFLWGFNCSGQISPNLAIVDQSAPTEFKIQENGKEISNILSVACGKNSTIILLNDLTFKILGKHSSQIQSYSFNMRSPIEIDKNFSDINTPYMVGNGSKFAINKKTVPYFLLSYVNEMQNSHTKIMISEYVKSIKLLRNHYPELKEIIESYETILYSLIANLKSAKDCLLFENENLITNTFVNIHFEELMNEFHRYLTKLCDCKSFYHSDKFAKHVDEKTFNVILERPFECLNIYSKLLDLIYDLKLYNNDSNRSDDSDFEINALKCRTTERKSRITEFKRYKTFKMNEAEETFLFWENAPTDVTSTELFTKKRRFWLDSQIVPLKLHDRNFFGTNRFILFNDFLVCLLNKVEITPINLVWLSNFQTTSSGKFSFKIITPESVLKVYSLSLEGKNHWQSKISQCISNSLGLKTSAPPNRFGKYEFTRHHPKYANYKIEGNWSKARFIGKCHISTKTRKFKCRITKPGELNGFGLIEEGNFTYEGEFKDGKMNGYGFWKNNTSSYEGFFKDDKFHGYGRFISDNYFEYYGEFLNGLRHGYGVEDNFKNGSKYFGYWQTGLKHGHGIIVELDGTYFEGIFNQNNLTGNGLVLLGSGSYYHGEMTSNGPNGNGSFYKFDSEIVEEVVELDDMNHQVKGTVLKGNLSGSWSEISIANGKMQLNEVFRKIPRRPDYHSRQTNVNKWKPFFDCWKEYVFETQDLLSLQQDERWDRLRNYMTKMKIIQFDRSSNFELNENPEYSISMGSQMNLQRYGSLRKSASNIVSISNSESFQELDNISVASIETPSISSSISAMKISEEMLENFEEGKEEKEDMETTFNAFIEEIRSFSYHPFHSLINYMQKIFCACHGNWKCKPAAILAQVAMEDWRQIMRDLCDVFFRLFYENMPDASDNLGFSYFFDSIYDTFMNEEIYSCLFLLYASKSSKQDETYNQRLLVCEKKTEEDLRSLLKIEQSVIPILEHSKFKEAIEMIKKISQKNCPLQMLKILKETFQKIEECSENCVLHADNLLPISIYLIIKSNVNHLGAELSLMEDLINIEDINTLVDFHQYILTTMKIGYLHTISSRFFHN